MAVSDATWPSLPRSFHHEYPRDGQRPCGGRGDSAHRFAGRAVRPARIRLFSNRTSRTATPVLAPKGAFEGNGEPARSPGRLADPWPIECARFSPTRGQLKRDCRGIYARPEINATPRRSIPTQKKRYRTRSDRSRVPVSKSGGQTPCLCASRIVNGRVVSRGGSTIGVFRSSIRSAAVVARGSDLDPRGAC
jgi:hypothetical protein